MLYSELQARTNNLCTHSEFEVINKAYMDAIDTPQEFDKEEAAILWNQLFGKKHQAAHLQYLSTLSKLLSFKKDGRDYLEDDAICGLIRDVEKQCKLDVLPFISRKTTRFKSHYGITWVVSRLADTPFATNMYSLSLIHDGRKVYICDFQWSN